MPSAPIVIAPADLATPTPAPPSALVQCTAQLIVGTKAALVTLTALDTDQEMKVASSWCGNLMASNGVFSLDWAYGHTVSDFPDHMCSYTVNGDQTVDVYDVYAARNYAAFHADTDSFSLSTPAENHAFAMDVCKTAEKAGVAVTYN
jgi:hypothetical protein